MRQDIFKAMKGIAPVAALVAALFTGGAALAQATVGDAPAHAIAMQGEPALPPGFLSLPYANPDAPKGGRIVLGESGSLDSLNPFIVKGNAASSVTPFTIETLMARSLDEPFTLYGLLAESVQTDAKRSYVEFTLRPEARFADGSPVTPEDVIWSFETLGTKGQPRYAGAWKKVARTEITGPRSVRFTFNAEDRELPLLLGLRPVLKKAQWEGKDFTESTLEAPIGSGPYVVAVMDAGRSITYRKNLTWWGKDLAVNRGMHNFDEIKVEYFGLDTALFEAFKAGEISSFRELNPAKWAANYDFPAVAEGRVVKEEIPHGRPSGIEGFAFNTRNPLFADWRVREALTLAFNFELVNQTLNGGVQPRIASYFGNSFLGMEPGKPATGRVAELLAPFKDQLLPGTIEGYAFPVSDGTEANRKNIRAATKLLAEAGWQVKNGVLTDAAGKPFAFEILLTQGQDEVISAASIYLESLKRLGIAARITTVDNAQYKERTNSYNFEMTHYIRALSLSPGNEQMLYWGKAGVTEPGTRNWPGIDSPAAEAMITQMLQTTDPAEFTAATQALDRVLTAGRYVIPLWYNKVSRLAYDARLKHPAHTPLYGDWPGWQPDAWWIAE